MFEIEVLLIFIFLSNTGESMSPFNINKTERKSMVFD